MTELRWKRSSDRTCVSHCGGWGITPIYGRYLRPIRYHLMRSDSIEGSGPTQRDCKVLAQRILDVENSLLRS